MKRVLHSILLIKDNYIVNIYIMGSLVAHATFVKHTTFKYRGYKSGHELRLIYTKYVRTTRIQV